MVLDSVRVVMFWVLSWFFVVALGNPSSLKNIPRLSSSSLFYCGKESLQFTLPATHADIIPFLTVIDSKGQPHPLDKSTCVSVSWKRGGSVVFTIPYAGCFFTKKNENYLMTLRIEKQDAAGKVFLHEEEVLCPIHLPDAPSSGICLGVQMQDWLPCASSPISREECEEKGCCYAPGDLHVPCYYGNTVTAHCTPDGHFLVAVSRDVTLPSLILDSVHLVSGRGSGCAPVTRNDAFVLYNFPLSACGTAFQRAGDQGIYTNELMAHHDIQNWDMGSITRDSTFRLRISCRYSAEGFLPVGVQIFTLPPPPLITQYGPLSLELRIATDKHYSEYYANRDYPVIKFLKDPVFLEVRILQRTDPNLVLVLHECWATPSTNPLQQPQWPILVNKCPYRGDNYQTQFVLTGTASRLQFPSHYKRFIINTFTFVDSDDQQALNGHVYFHCSAAACIPSAMESCMVDCNGIRVRRTPVNKTLQNTPKSLVTAEGPVDFQMAKAQNHVVQEGSPWASPILSKEWETAFILAVGALSIALAVLGLRKYWKRSKCERANTP
ncbi:zona pellucida sperm-binding protein 4-like [Varanus komodoensis]|uniref:zona pellucida sperm-binding protein 4-like n=1 Tax=Varanus komodoensis TaxID=61221 RepID=UPI001CF76DB3|nr:zona pellucida sperm-binding protein 4-like [Varanus komodoensis]